MYVLLIKRRQAAQHLLPMLWVDEPNTSNKTYHILHYEDGFVKRHYVPAIYRSEIYHAWDCFSNDCKHSVLWICLSYSPDCMSPWFYALRFHYDFLTLKIYYSVPPDTDILKYSLFKHSLKPIWKVEFRYFQPIYWTLWMFNWKMVKTMSSVPSY